MVLCGALLGGSWTASAPAGAQDGTTGPATEAPATPAREFAPVETDASTMTITYREGVTPAEADHTPLAPGFSAADAALQDPCEDTSSPSLTVGDFRFSFGAGIDADERAAIAAAADAWSDTLVARRPIEVRVELDEGNFEPGMVGGAGPCDFFAPPGYPAYPAAAANQLANDDLNGGRPEIGMLLSSTEDFYTGTDDDVPANDVSLTTLAMHELGHGLGHTTLAGRLAGGTLVINFDDGTPYIYDTFVRSSGRDVTRLSRAALQSALVNPLTWAGAEGRRAAKGSIALYAPNPFLSGSSVSHVKASGQLMSPFIETGSAILSVPRRTGGMMADIGWVLENKLGNQAFVAALGPDFLDRPSSFDEIANFADIIAIGDVTRGDVVAAYATSDEWIGNIVDGLYASTLGRKPDDAGRRYWIGVLRTGQTPAQVAAYFYAGTEYYQRAGATNRRWVQDLYAEILHRQADASGLNYWAGLAARGKSRSEIAFHFYQSVESRRDRVASLYRQLLGRSPDRSGHEYWAKVLTNGRDVDLARFLAQGEEYFIRAGQRF